VRRHSPERDGQPAASARFVARQVLVLIRSSGENTIESDLAQTYGLDPVSNAPLPLLDARMQLYHIRGSRSVGQLVAALRVDSRVLSAQPNFLYRHQGQESAAAPSSVQYSIEKLRLPSAHKLSQGRGVLIAVIDSAIDANHPDLKDAVAGSFDAVGGASEEGDAHGTAIAGIIRAQGYASGVAPEARLLAVRAFSAKSTDQDPEATSTALLRAIQWAVDNSANVLNMSFTGPKDPGVERAISEARSRNVITVAAAGNGGPNAPPAYPAAYPGVIAVTATDERDRPYKDANHGRYIAVAAPGVDVLAPVTGGGYQYFTGTSFAAAEVSGVMALLLERKKVDPGLAREIVTRTAESLGPRRARDEVGAGLVDAYESLKALDGR
jgi:subtilisin family serine protease